MQTTFQYKGHTIEIELTHEYVFLPLRHIINIDGHYVFRSRGKFRKFITAEAALAAAKRLINGEEVA
jgi:hypothetical protein